MSVVSRAMGRGVLPGVLLALGVAVAVAAMAPERVEGTGQELLNNPGFDSGTEGWATEGTVEPGGGRLHVTGDHGLLKQLVTGVQPFGVYTAAASVEGESGAFGIEFYFLGQDGALLASAVPERPLVYFPSAPTAVSYTATAPAGSQRLVLQLRFSRSPIDAYIDWASLTMTPGQAPTATPTEFATEVPTPTETPTKIPTATKTPTPTKTVTPTKTPTPPKVATATRTPGSGSGGATPAGPAPTSEVRGVEAAGPKTLRISEFLSDPEEAGRDSPFEWVELVNAGEAPVDLEGWSIGDAGAMDVLPAAVVGPGEYVVIAGREAALPEGVAVVRVGDGEIGRGLNNAGDVIRLMAPDGTVVDAISYGDNRTVFDAPPAAPGPGETLGLREPASEASSRSWAVTTRPSPGSANTFPAAVSPTEPAGGGNERPSGTPRAVQVVEVETGSNGPSELTWVVLGGAIVAGAAGAIWTLGPRVAGEVRRRWRRGR